MKGVIIVIGKKGDTSYCGNNRGITLRAAVSTLLRMILLRRMNVGMERLLSSTNTKSLAKEFSKILIV